MTSPFRIEPVAGPAAYKTYSLHVPRETHRRAASCQEVDCDAWRLGWVTTIEVATELGAKQARYIREQSGRSFTEQFSAALGLATFTFPAGQRCFRPHEVSLEREPLAVIRDGDWRANPTRRRQVVSLEDWRDDFGEHQDRLHDLQERG